MAVSAIWQAREGNHRTQGEVVGDTGLEPVIACMSSKCSNQDMLPGRQCLTVHVPWTTGLRRRVGFHVELRTYSRDHRVSADAIPFAPLIGQCIDLISPLSERRSIWVRIAVGWIWVRPRCVLPTSTNAWRRSGMKWRTWETYRSISRRACRKARSLRNICHRSRLRANGWRHQDGDLEQ